LTLRILADENIPAVTQSLGALGCVERINGRSLQRSQLQGADALLVRSVTRVNEALLTGSSIKFIGSATSGVDHIDREYLARQGIAFAHAPGSNANSVVEYVLSAIAAVDDMLERLFDGGEVGIVGYGYVGKALAARLGALNIRYRVFDPWLDQSSVSCAATLEEVLGCDVVSMHPELTTEQPWPSHHLLGQDELQRISSETLLINTSRGSVVDNDALLALLETGSGALTVLDVWDPEPNINASLLEYVTLGTPHIAGYSLDGKLKATRMLCDALAGYFQLPPLQSDSLHVAAAEISVPNTVSGSALVRHLLQCRYDITRDDGFLREMVCAAPNDHGVGFDHLRKHYAERRELSNSLVLCEKENHALVESLGCTTTAGGIHQ
jgi:erythronate-4-phosphate dehydrogenase